MVDGQPWNTVCFNRAQITPLKGSLKLVNAFTLHSVSSEPKPYQRTRTNKQQQGTDAVLLYDQNLLYRKVKTFKKISDKDWKGTFFRAPTVIVSHLVLCKLNTCTQRRHKHQLPSNGNVTAQELVKHKQGLQDSGGNKFVKAVPEHIIQLI